MRLAIYYLFGSIGHNFTPSCFPATNRFLMGFFDWLKLSHEYFLAILITFTTADSRISYILSFLNDFKWMKLDLRTGTNSRKLSEWKLLLKQSQFLPRSHPLHIYIHCYCFVNFWISKKDIFTDKVTCWYLLESNYSLNLQADHSVFTLSLEHWL